MFEIDRLAGQEEDVAVYISTAASRLDDALERAEHGLPLCDCMEHRHLDTNVSIRLLRAPDETTSI